MGISDIFKTGKIKDELEEYKRMLTESNLRLKETKAECEVLKASLSEVNKMNYLELKKATLDLGQIKFELESQIKAHERKIGKSLEYIRLKEETISLTQNTEKLKNDILLLGQTIKNKQKEIIILDETILLQSFGVYNPKYNLENSYLYLSKLKEIQEEQNIMIKYDTAALCSKEWKIDGSIKEGEKVINDNKKLLIRAINNECDVVIAKVKFNNIDQSVKRIEKSYETLNKLSERFCITIAGGYLNLKLKELFLTHEYQIKKQEEKEEQKRLREEAKEDAKALKEIEEAKRSVEKEENHFKKALEKLQKQLEDATNETNRQAILDKQKEILVKLDDIEKIKQDIQNREQNTRAGHVYVISNIGAFGENIYKIGMTRRLDPFDRVDELGDASVPFKFDVHAMIFTPDAPKLENALHKAFENRKLNMINVRREFFSVTLDEIEKVVRKNYDKTVEFVKLADAKEYRESKMMQK